MSTILRGGILCAWMLVLALVAVFSLKDTLSEAMIRTLSERASEDVGWYQFEARYLDEDQNLRTDVHLECPSVAEMEYDLSYGNDENPVPIVATLYQIDPDWEAKWIYFKENGKQGDTTCNYEKAVEIFKRYDATRNALISELRAIASEENVDIKTAKINTSVIFNDKKSKTEMVDLPATAKSWLKRERVIVKQNQESLALLSTFMRLSILGAFGAIIFLIRDFTTPDGKSKPISTYIYRPFLGIFLAIAVFVVDIMAHSVISTASILQIRPEPLYILALAAGLLSERVYDVIQNKARGAIDEYTEEKKPGNSEPTAPP